MCYNWRYGYRAQQFIIMSIEAHITRAVTKALEGAGNVVGLNGAQLGDVCIGYVAGGDIHVTVNVFSKSLGWCENNTSLKKSLKHYKNRFGFVSFEVVTVKHGVKSPSSFSPILVSPGTPDTKPLP